MKALLFALLAFPVLAWSASTTLNWTHPARYVDGTPLTLPEIAQTRIEFGTCAGNVFAKLGQVTKAAPATTTVATVPAATNCYRAFTSTVGGVESDATTLLPDQPCPARPATETRQQACTPPLVGNWPQTRGWASIAAPACWEAAAWLPTQAPAGVCAAVPTNFVTADTKAYEVRTGASVFLTLVGITPAGVSCGPQTQKINGLTYCRIPITQADLVNFPSNVALTELWVRAAP